MPASWARSAAEHDQRRIGDDARLAVDELRQLREGLHAVLRPGLRGAFRHGVRLLLRLLLPQFLLDLLDVETRVPDVEVGRLGQRSASTAVRANGGRHGRLPLGVAELAVAACDLEARHEPLHVPLERAGERLVEVVEVEDERALGRRVAADVREVRVSAELRPEPGSRSRREVVGHHGRRAAVEGERRDEHPAVADGHELRNARLRLRLQDRDRITVGRELEAGLARARALLARGAAARGALFGREVRYGARRVLARSFRRWSSSCPPQCANPVAVAASWVGAGCFSSRASWRFTSASSMSAMSWVNPRRTTTRSAARSVRFSGNV